MGALSGTLQEAGHIVRPVGMKGELKLDTIEPLSDEFLNAEIMFFKNDRGDFPPLRIKSIREGGTSGQSFFVTFVSVDDRSKAEAFNKKSMYVDSYFLRSCIIQTTTSYIGYTVLDTLCNFEGVVFDELENKAHLILSVSTHHTSLLIPFVDAYVVKVDHQHNILHCQNLQYLMEA